MPLDPRIPLGVQPPPIQNPLEALSQLTQMQAQREQMEIRRLAAEEAREKRNRQARYEQALQRAVSIGPDGQPTIDFEKLLPDVDAGTLFEVKKTVDENAKRMADLRTSNLTAEDKTAEYLAGRGREVAAAKYHPDAYGLALTATRKAGVMTQAQVDQLLDEAKADPTAIQRHTDAAIARVTDAKATTAGSFEDYVQRVGATTPEALVEARRVWETAGRGPGQGSAVGSLADYVLRRFGPNPTPEQLLQAKQEYSPGGEGGALGDFADYLSRRFGPTPTAAQIEQARKDYAVPAPSYIWAQPPGATTPQLMPTSAVIATGAQKPAEPATHQQSLAGGFAQRMEQAEPIFSGGVGTAINNMSLPAFTVQTSSWFAKPTFQSNEVQKYMQASRNFINAVLRRESGAVISPAEFANAKAQYLPLPGDTEEAAAQKKANRELVVDSMRQEAGSAYQAPAAKTAPPEVAAALKGEKAGRYTLSDGSVWEKHVDGSLVKVK